MKHLAALVTTAALVLVAPASATAGRPCTPRVPEAEQAAPISRSQDTSRRITDVTPDPFRPPHPDTHACALNGVHTVGRLDDRGTGVRGADLRGADLHGAGVRGADLRGAGVRYTWPGVYFEGRFRGTSVGIVLDDAVNDYDVQIDGRAAATLVTPGRTTHWIRDLAPGAHTVRLAKRTESPWTPGQFGGFTGDLLGKPAARDRQIEFIGDSWTAGYGNTSAGRDCSATGIDRNSNADQTFGALTARTLGADYQLNAWSGMGLVRNYDGGNAEVDYRTYYDRVLQAADEAVWQRPPTWRPQTVVIGLGINDFSTPVHAGERWPDEAALAAGFRAAYLDFLKKLRQRYGHRTRLVLTYPSLWNTTALADSVQQVVAERTAAGDHRITALHYDNAALGLDLLGCDWHPSARDHQLLAGALTAHLRALG